MDREVTDIRQLKRTTEVFQTSTLHQQLCQDIAEKLWLLRLEEGHNKKCEEQHKTERKHIDIWEQ